MHLSSSQLRSTTYKDAREYLKMLYYDALSYGSAEMGFTSDIASSDEARTRKGGAARMHFGSDCPFFPPIGDAKENKWTSVMDNLNAIEEMREKGWDQEDLDGVRGLNTLRLLGIQE